MGGSLVGTLPLPACALYSFPGIDEDDMGFEDSCIDLIGLDSYF